MNSCRAFNAFCHFDASYGGKSFFPSLSSKFRASVYPPLSKGLAAYIHIFAFNANAAPRVGTARRSLGSSSLSRGATSVISLSRNAMTSSTVFRA